MVKEYNSQVTLSSSSKIKLKVPKSDNKCVVKRRAAQATVLEELIQNLVQDFENDTDILPMATEYKKFKK